MDEDAFEWMGRFADGDARRRLTALEAAVSHLPFRRKSSVFGVSRSSLLEDLFKRKVLLYDKSGEEHFNLISALHKSLRDSDVDASLYWLARMLEAGEDPLYVARRLVRFASEDVGLADASSLALAIAAKEAVHFIGMPEGALALAEISVHLALAPKSNALYTAYGEAVADVHERPNEPPPLAIRNAPTKLMKQVGYGRATGTRTTGREDGGPLVPSRLPRGTELLPAVGRGCGEGPQGARRGCSGAARTIEKEERERMICFGRQNTQETRPARRTRGHVTVRSSPGSPQAFANGSANSAIGSRAVSFVQRFTDDHVER